MLYVPCYKFFGDLVNTAGNTGGLEELAEAWRFLGALSQQTTALRDILALWNDSCFRCLASGVLLQVTL